MCKAKTRVVVNWWKDFIVTTRDWRVKAERTTEVSKRTKVYYQTTAIYKTKTKGFDKKKEKGKKTHNHTWMGKHGLSRIPMSNQTPKNLVTLLLNTSDGWLAQFPTLLMYGVSFNNLFSASLSRSKATVLCTQRNNHCTQISDATIATIFIVFYVSFMLC